MIYVKNDHNNRVINVYTDGSASVSRSKATGKAAKSRKEATDNKAHLEGGWSAVIETDNVQTYAISGHWIGADCLDVEILAVIGALLEINKRKQTSVDDRVWNINVITDCQSIRDMIRSHFNKKDANRHESRHENRPHFNSLLRVLDYMSTCGHFVICFDWERRNRLIQNKYADKAAKTAKNNVWKMLQAKRRSEVVREALETLFSPHTTSVSNEDFEELYNT